MLDEVLNLLDEVICLLDEVINFLNEVICLLDEVLNLLDEVICLLDLMLPPNHQLHKLHKLQKTDSATVNPLDQFNDLSIEEIKALGSENKGVAI